MAWTAAAITIVQYFRVAVLNVCINEVKLAVFIVVYHNHTVVKVGIDCSIAYVERSIACAI